MSAARAMVIAILASINTSVVVLGLWFTSVSISAHTQVSVFGNRIPAFLLGIMVVFIGAKSFIKLYRLAKLLRNRDLRFSWQNFNLKGGH